MTFTVILLLLLVFTLVGCKEKPLENTEDIEIGIVETIGTDYKSFIHWYDDELEVVDVQKLKYAGLGSTFHRPVYEEQDIYLIPEGIFTKKDSEKVISLNKEDFTITEYDVPNIALANVAVTDDYIFTNSNLNYETHISRVDKKGKMFSERLFEGAYFHSMMSAENKLFLLGNIEDNIDETYLYVLDTDFNVLETIDLTDVGRGGDKFLLDNQDLYLSIPFTVGDQDNSILLKINIETYEQEVIDLETDYPDTILKYQDKLIIAHNDLITGEGSLITVLDPITNEKESFDLKTNLPYVDLYQDHLVVSDGETVSLFAIEQDFELVKEVVIEKQEEDSYISDILIID